MFQRLNPDGVPLLNVLTSIAAAGSTTTDAALLTPAGPYFVVTAGDGVKGVMLPSASVTKYSGAKVEVYNSGSGSVRVYPFTAGTINGAAANIPVAVGAGQTRTFTCTGLDTWVAGAGTINSIGAAVAAAGSTAADAGQLTGENYITVTAADGTKGVKMPAVGAGDKGKTMTVRNTVAAVLKIYATVGGAINGGSVDAAVSIAASAFTILICTGANTWDAMEIPAA